MVFSFFKKPPEKMVARPAAVPRPKETARVAPAPVLDSEKDGHSAALNKSVPLDFTPSPIPVSSTAQTPSAQTSEDANFSLDFSDSEFSQSSLNFQVDGESDPADSDAEEAAVLFANGQDDAARSVLENAVQVHRSARGERLWLMLFDLYRLTGQKSAFEILELNYAQTFEKSPPAWRDKSKRVPKAKNTVAGSLLFRGELTGDNDVAFDTIRQALAKNPKLRLDLTKIIRLDAEGCGQLLTLMQQARKSKHEVELLGRDSLGVLLQKCVEVGRAENKDCWLLFLELCQLQGQAEIFEDVAINYAVTFEVSPPSWEPQRVAAPEPAAQASVVSGDDEAEGDDYVLRGDVKAARFLDLPTYAEVHDPVVIDCAAVSRMDFISAGALLNVLTVIRRAGKQIVFQHPNHLVAGLFNVVGLAAVSTVVFEKH